MAVVETVNGPIDVEALGQTLMHEHVLLLDPEILKNYPGEGVPEDVVATAAGKLRKIKGQGVDTIVDLTVIGLGRDVEQVRAIAHDTGLNVIVATGIYAFDKVPKFFRFRGPTTPGGGPEVMTELFIRDIREGIADTGIKAAILKCATDVEGVTPDVERVLRACGQTQRETGVPITTHADASTRRGLEQQRVLRDEGVDLSRVVIGHCGDTTDLEYLTAIMDAGSFVGMDRFGLQALLSTEDRIKTVAELIRRGYVDRIVLSQDASACGMTFSPEVLERLHPDYRLDYIFESVIPVMGDYGISDDEIHTMLVANPRKIFATQGAY